MTFLYFKVLATSYYSKLNLNLKYLNNGTLSYLLTSLCATLSINTIILIVCIFNKHKLINTIKRHSLAVIPPNKRVCKRVLGRIMNSNINGAKAVAYGNRFGCYSICSFGLW